MIPTLHNLNLLRRCRADDAVDQALFSGNSPRPPSAEIFFQRFWLAEGLERIAHRVLKQFVGPREDRPVGILPV